MQRLQAEKSHVKVKSRGRGAGATRVTTGPELPGSLFMPAPLLLAPPGAAPPVPAGVWNLGLAGENSSRS
jgi:hypothetical protein